MHRVTRDKTELLFEWADGHEVPTNHVVSQFKEIGPTGPDRWGNGRGEIKIPCSIATKSGASNQRAIAVITKMPPISYDRKSALLGNQVTTVARSDFALPLDVRLATLNATETSMGFAPTCVQANGQFFILSGPSVFFEYGWLKGRDISLCPIPPLPIRDFPIVGNDNSGITYVYYDWFLGCETLIRTTA
jgi:hypothetical protein